MLSFSRSGLRKAVVWLLCFQLGALLVTLGAIVGCVVIVLKEQVSFQMITGVAMVGLVGVVGLCYFLMTLASWKLFFFSTIPSSSYYLVTSDQLVRYSRADEVLEEIPFANIADVSLVTKRNEENPEVTARVLGIDLRNLNDRKTILDRAFCRWSQKMHNYDLVLVEDFFDIPLKTVYRKIKRRWQTWQETHPGSAADADAPPTARRRRRLAWYQKPLTYVVGGLGLAGLVGLVVLLILLGAGDAGNVPAPAPGPVAGPPQGNNPAAEPFGPRSLPGLLAYWPLDEAQGKVANDASGNGSLGHIHGGEWLQGVKGSALRLGKGDFVDLGSAHQLNFGPAAPFTIAGWVATRSNGAICSFRRRTSIFPIVEISVRKGQLAGWVRDDTSGFGGAKVRGAAVNDGNWHHVALLRQGDGTIELFLDGTSQGRDKGKSSGGPITTDLRALGCDLFLSTRKKPPGYLAGSLDEFCVYNQALAPAEITALAGRK
jgi:hypothetical protein